MFAFEKNSWTRERFGDVVSNRNETVRDPSAAGIDKVIALEHLDPGELTITRYGDVANGTTFTRHVRPGQTLFGKRRAYQRKAVYAETEAICSGDILVFEALADRLSPRLLPFLVHSEAFFSHALGTSAGSLSPRTSWRALADFEMYLPSRDEQERIADLLWAMERHRQALATLERKVADASFAHFQQASRLASGRRVRLGEVLQVVRGGSPRPISEFLTDNPDGLNWIKIGDVPADGKYIDRTAEKIRPAGLAKTRTVEPGDFLLSNSMSFGRPYIVRIHGCIHDGWLALSDIEGAWRSDYLYHLLRGEDVQSQFRSKAAGSTVKNLNIDIVRSVEVAMPPVEEQDLILAEMERLGSATEATTAARRSVTKLRSQVLAHLFPPL